MVWLGPPPLTGALERRFSESKSSWRDEKKCIKCQKFIEIYKTGHRAYSYTSLKQASSPVNFQLYRAYSNTIYNSIHMGLKLATSPGHSLLAVCNIEGLGVA